MTSAENAGDEPLSLDQALINSMTEFFKFVSNPVRLRILWLLQNGEWSVSNIEKATGTHQPTLSQQLSLLREGGIITARREHKTVFYTLTDKRMIRLLKWLARNYEGAPLSRTDLNADSARANMAAAVFVRIGDPA